MFVTREAVNILKKLYTPSKLVRPQPVYSNANPNKIKQEDKPPNKK